MRDEERMLRALRGCRVFAGCREELLLQIPRSPFCRIEAFKGGTVLSQHGGALGILLKGKITVSALREGKKLVLNRHEQGAVFGFSSLFAREQAPFCTRLEAKGQTEILWIGQELILELMKKESTVAQNIISHQASKIRFLNGKILSLTRPGAEERLYRYLLLQERDEEGILRASLSMSEVALRLNISRASAYRAMEKLIEDGKIEKSGNTLKIKGATQ